MTARVALMTRAVVPLELWYAPMSQDVPRAVPSMSVENPSDVRFVPAPLAGETDWSL
jgi:hypothetical protein